MFRVASESSSSWRNLLVFHEKQGQGKGWAGEAGCFHWVGGRERLWGQQRKEEKQGRGEGADSSSGSFMAGPDRQRRTLSSKKFHFFDGDLSFILVLLSTQHVQTVDVLPFLKAW